MSAVPYNTPTRTSQNMLTTLQVVQAVAVQPTQLPEPPSTSRAHPSAPTGNTGAASSLLEIEQGRLSENQLQEHLAALKETIWAAENTFCAPCWGQCHGFEHPMHLCSHFLERTYITWKAKLDLPTGNCFWCCFPTVCDFPSSLLCHVPDDISQVGTIYHTI